MSTLQFFGIVAVILILALLLPRFLRHLEPKFYQRPLLNKSERRLYGILVRALPSGWSVMCQVSYGAVLGNQNYNRYMSVNSKRADFMIFDRSLRTMSVVEYQGLGHFGSSKVSKRRAMASDKIKRQALQEAGIPMFEVQARYSSQEIREFIQALSTPQLPTDPHVEQKIG